MNIHLNHKLTKLEGCGPSRPRVRFGHDLSTPLKTGSACPSKRLNQTDQTAQSGEIISSIKTMKTDQSVSERKIQEETKTMNTNQTHQFFASLRTRLLMVVVASVVLLCVPDTQGQATPNPPNRMTYQGFLVDANGMALGLDAPKNYDVVFRIWKHESSTAVTDRLWTEQQTVTVDKGYFSVLLGEGTPIGELRPDLSAIFTGADASDRWVGVTVKGIGSGNPPGDVDILPRLRLLTSPYAFLAQNAVNSTKLVNATTGSDLVTTTGGGVTVSGSIAANTFTGNGAQLSALNASSIATGTVADNRLSSNIALRNGGNTFNDNQTFNANLQIGNFGVDDRYLTIASAGANRFVTGLKLRHFNNEHGWTMESDERILYGVGAGATLLFKSHFFNAAGDTQVALLPNGRVGIGTTSPTGKLDVRGDVKMGSAGDVFAAGGQENLRIVRAIIQPDGTVFPGTSFTGTGFTVTKGTAGKFTINFNPGFADTPAVTITPNSGTAPATATWNQISSSKIELETRSGTTLVNLWFTFIAIGRR